MAGQDGINPSSWKLLSLLPGIYGKRGIICTFKEFPPLWHPGRLDSNLIFYF
jgi:hypothetical protein